MNRLIRFYNKNRKSIWKIIGVILIILAILQLLNYIAKHKQNRNNVNNNTIQYNNLNLKTEKSVLSGEEISNNKKDSIKIIDNFFLYCNQQKLQKAYDLLTEECKEEMYSSIEGFEKMYYEKILKGQKKNISVENWIGDTYKVTINEDFLSSGKYSTDNIIQDYITVKDEKLNINSYIGRTTPNKENKKKNINIKVLKKNMYINYTTYTFEVTNDSQRTILLDTLENIDSMYIEDNNGIKYSAYTHELSKAQLLINEGEKRQITIKYYSKFGSDKTIKKVIFSRFVLDYSESLDNSKDVFEISL